jgi:hypothetical protein
MLAYRKAASSKRFLERPREESQRKRAAVEDLLLAYFTPLLRLVFGWIALICAFRVLFCPKAKPGQ